MATDALELTLKQIFKETISFIDRSHTWSLNKYILTFKKNS